MQQDSSSNQAKANVSTANSNGSFRPGKEARSDYSRMADVLGDTIAYRPPPLTVGVFGKWGTGKTRMLTLIKDRVKKVTNSVSDMRIGFFKVFFRLLFFHPNFNVPKSKDVKFIFVDFSIIDYAGSDNIWAGVITHIADAIERSLGKWPVKFFRAWHYKPDMDLKMFLTPPEELPTKDHKHRWKVAIVALLVLLFVMLLILAVVLIWTYTGVPSFTAALGSTDMTAAIISTSLATVLGLGAATKISGAVQMVINMIKSQSQKVKDKAAESGFSKKLGFMYLVKTEIFYTTSLVKYASHMMEQDIRICLLVDDIDILSSEKTMSLFQVVSLLQNAPNSPYVQVMTMDPYIVSSVVKNALNSSLKSGHAYLRKHIELPFHIPSLDETNKMFLVLTNNYIRQLKERLGRPSSSPRRRGNSPKKRDEEIPLVEIVAGQERQTRPRSDSIDYEKSWEAVRDCFLDNPDFISFIDGNEKRVLRILSSTQLAYRMMEIVNRKKADSSMARLVPWIILADQWPYRLSCIWQTIEDSAQLNELEPVTSYKFSPTSKLLDIYRLAMSDLTAVTGWKNFLELDGDPEIFLQFMVNFQLTVQELEDFLPYTTNLDRSLRRIIANAIANKRVDNMPKFKRHLARWRNKKSLGKWTVDDVCNELKLMGLKGDLDKYLKMARESDLDGSTLLLSSHKELRDLVEMTLEDWLAAKDHIAALKNFYRVKRRSLIAGDDLHLVGRDEVVAATSGVPEMHEDHV